MTLKWYNKNRVPYNIKRRKRYAEDKEYRGKAMQNSKNYRVKYPNRKKKENHNYKKSERGKLAKKRDRIKNKEYYDNYQKEYWKDESRLKKRSEKNKTRLLVDKEYAIKKRLRNSLLRAISLYSKNKKLTGSKNYGIHWDKIIEHLKPFPKNLSKYHIDHIKPLCSFEFVNEDGSTNLEEVQKAFAPKNHQWLTIKENLMKGGLFLLDDGLV